ncbi:Two component transcriptional regulator [Bifidobacterium avesanii]|nr:response regulator transcription factor [Bifidobacterium avesanii]KAB8290619.1 Two component transcriptional regulator [Bifidobacterium avesanii]
MDETGSTGTFTVGIADNDALSLRSLERIIAERVPDATVLWTTQEGPQAVIYATSQRTQPDVLMVDMSMESMPGLMICRRIRRATNEVPMLAITSFTLGLYAEDAGRCGAQGIASKNNENDLVAGLNAVVDGGTYGEGGFETAAMAHYRLECAPATVEDMLTTREAQTMDLLAEGLDDEMIAKRLQIGRDTVRKHVQTAMHKLGVSTRWQALLRWSGSEKNGRRYVL